MHASREKGFQLLLYTCGLLSADEGCCMYLVARDAVSYQRGCDRQRTLRVGVRRRTGPGCQRPATSVLRHTRFAVDLSVILDRIGHRFKPHSNGHFPREPGLTSSPPPDFPFPLVNSRNHFSTDPNFHILFGTVPPSFLRALRSACLFPLTSIAVQWPDRYTILTFIV